MKQSKKVSVRLKRAIAELTEKGNHYNIGNVILEDLIIQAIKLKEEEIKTMDRTRNYFVPICHFEETFEIIKKHLA
jgi:hypothetical protein